MAQSVAKCLARCKRGGNHPLGTPSCFRDIQAGTLGMRIAASPKDALMSSPEAVQGHLRRGAIVVGATCMTVNRCRIDVPCCLVMWISECHVWQQSLGAPCTQKAAFRRACKRWTSFHAQHCQPDGPGILLHSYRTAELAIAPSNDPPCPFPFPLPWWTLLRTLQEL